LTVCGPTDKSHTVRRVTGPVKPRSARLAGPGNNGKFGEQDITALLLELDGKMKLLRAGDMSDVEAMLFSQATALQAIFVDLATRAQRQERLPIMQAQLT
jgi:hypothetical protein